MAEEKGCFSNKTKACCAKFVLFVSMGLILIGLISAIYGYFGLDIEDRWELGNITFPSPLALFGLLAILAGLFSMLTGVLGVLAAKYKKCCFTLPFMIFAVVMCIFMLIVAMIAFIGQGATTQVRDAFCNGGDSLVVGNKFYDGLTGYMLKMYGGTMDRYMCTPQCPCHDGVKELYKSATLAEPSKLGFHFTTDGDSPNTVKKYRSFDESLMSAS